MGDYKEKASDLESNVKPARPITDIDEIRKYVKVRNPEQEEEILQMIANSEALLKGHFRIED